ncbi:MAG TPA: hypothetical protein VKW06_07290 [Candidatus Angelobacter sp.]|nr:hypothetical protein [Candidatus Angelobacter sp.]
MRLSADEAKQLLDKWATDKSPVRIAHIARSGYLAVAMSGTLWGLPPNDVAVKSFFSPDEDCVTFRFTGCTFEYGDNREAPAHLRDYAKGKYESVVTILFPESSERVYLFELKSKPRQP